MANLDEFTASVILSEASYRGAFFYIKSSEIAGGRKDAKKEFIASDLQVIEDLGLKQKIFTVNGTIAARFNGIGITIKSYNNIRNDLLAALDKGGSGILVHPWHGVIRNVVCRSYTLSENTNKVGEASISMTFEISNTDGLPVVSENLLTNIISLRELLSIASILILGTRFSVSANATGNFQAAVDKLNKFVNTVRDATLPVAALKDQINEHTGLVNSFSNNVASLVNNPNNMSNSVAQIMNSIDGLYSTPQSALTAFGNLFNFGDDDINLPQITFIALERKRNNDIFNSTIQTEALSYSYLNASQINYITVDEITEEASRLEVQYQKLAVDENVNEEAFDALTELRVVTQGFFDDEKLTASQVITINTNPLSTRLIAYQYYGSSEQGEAIAELNGLYDLWHQQGDIEIFSA